MKDTNIQHRAMRNSLVGLVSFIFSLAQAIFIVPILLKYWGNEIYGIWLSLYAGFTLLQSLDTGHINYIGNKINITYNLNREELRLTLASSFLMAIIIGMVQIALVAILIIFNFLPSFLGLEANILIQYSIPASLLILITFWFFSGSFGGIIHRIMIPSGFYFESQWWGILFRLCQFLSIVLVALLGGSILEACIFYVVIQLIVYVLTFIYIKRKIPEFYPWWKGAKLNVSFSNFNKSLILTLNGFVQQLNINGIILFISNLLSATFVPVFTTIRTLTNTAISITSVLLNSLLPDIVRYHTKKETGKLNSVFNAHWFFSGAMINIGVLLILPFINSIYTFWTKGLLQFDYKLFITLSASISLINFGAGYFFYLISINNLKSQIIITLTRVSIIFSSGFFLVKGLGLSGIGIAILFSELVCSILLPTLFVKIEFKGSGINPITNYYFLALLPPSILLMLVMSVILIGQLNPYIWTILLIIVCSVYIYNWNILDNEVKDRSKYLIRNLFKSF
jgi:O-antigen/teichoic acid export membrane protein